VLKKVEWTPGRVSALSLDRLKCLRVNALRYEDHYLVSLCDAEIASRVLSPKAARTVSRRSGRSGRFVTGFHFVCERDKGVTTNSDGTFWTGTWVVDQRHAERAPAVNAYVALHATKSEPSYRQGVVRGRPRLAESRTRAGIWRPTGR
jgi:hypothetical protein